jgi:hypothetical protein
LNQTVCLYEFGTAERASSPSCQVNCFTGEAYNPYGVEIPFQFDGRDGTITATYGDATPQGLVLQVHSSSRISIGNLAPIQASGAMCCTLYGEGEEATCPSDGGPEDDCEDNGCQCVGFFDCGYTSCNRLFNGADPETNVPLEGDNTDLLHDFEPTAYNCTLMRCCRQMYQHFKIIDEFPNPIHHGEIFEDGRQSYHPIDAGTRDARLDSMNEWWDRNTSTCGKHIDDCDG